MQPKGVNLTVATARQPHDPLGLWTRSPTWTQPLNPCMAARVSTPLPGKVLVVGATGQTGKMLVKELLENGSNAVEKLVAYGNSRLPTYEGPNASKFTAMQAPMAELSTTRSAEVRGFDTIFVHVGTQRRKVGLEAQQKLEFDHTLAVCKAAREGGCKTCHIVSSQGANSSSGIPYLQTKGRIEEALRGVGFDRLVVYRPGNLHGGDRDTAVKNCVIGTLRVLSFGAIKRIHVDQVGKFMRVVAMRPGTGKVELYENDAIQVG